MTEVAPESEAMPLELDPLLRALARPVLSAPAPVGEPGPRMLPAIPESLVRRIAWGEHRGRGVARLEFGGGVLAGASLMIESHGGLVSLVLELPVGTSAGDWEERLSRRLQRRGLALGSVTVR